MVGVVVATLDTVLAVMVVTVVTHVLEVGATVMASVIIDASAVQHGVGEDVVKTFIINPNPSINLLIN